MTNLYNRIQVRSRECLAALQLNYAIAPRPWWRKRIDLEED